MKAKLIGVVCAMLLGSQAMASTCSSTSNWGPLGPPGLALFGHSFASTGSYLDCYTFSLSGPAVSFGGVIEIDPTFFGLDMNQLAIDVTSISLFSGGVDGLGGTGSLYGYDGSASDFSFSGLTAGTYTLAVASSITNQWGLMPGSVGYLGSIATSSPVASPAPEPESLALMLAGLAGVGAAVRRRRGA